MDMTIIGINNNDYRVKDYILSKLDSLKKEKTGLYFENYLESDTLFIKCCQKENFLSNIKDNKNVKEKDDFIYNIAAILTDAIIENYESHLIKKVIKDYYIYITEKEKTQIFECADKLIRNERNPYNDIIYKQSRISKVKGSILNYLKTEDLIILEGFINFRLNEYMKELYVIVDKAAEDFITQKEYKEFIKLLRYFVDIQETKIHTIHIVVEDGGRYVLLDNNKTVISYEIYDENGLRNVNIEVNNDDVLISNLITIAPKKIYIHNIDKFTNKELIQTIQNVFYDRTILCYNGKACDFCTVKLSNKLN